MQDKRFKSWVKSGSPWVWFTGAAIAISMIMVVGLLLLIAARGMGYFWPGDVYQFEYAEPGKPTITVMGEIYDEEVINAQQLSDQGIVLPDDVTKVTRYLVKTGNRDVYGLDFRWLIKNFISKQSKPENALIAERREWGNFYGTIVSVRENQVLVGKGEEAWPEINQRIEYTNDIHSQATSIERGAIGSINHKMEKLRLQQRQFELDNEATPDNLGMLDKQRAELNEKYQLLQAELNKLYAKMKRDTITVRTAEGKEIALPLQQVIHIWQPNSMSNFAKIKHYVQALWAFVAGEPREANTEGGIFPAIFGTVMMVITMSIFVTPFGVIAAVYLREYAKQGAVTRLVRIAVNNLAGVPSIVYGVFGLGFFVYFLGGNIDQLFFPEALPAPTFGTPGILWSSLTLAILTVPVVIVATEEGLSRIPRNVREGSLALGATKWETLWKTIIPMASPAIMTGLILAIARAAGEVAPLMLVGVVKLAPTLPLDGNMPFVHLDRKFMHLGFHIYDVGFQSPNVEAARPLVYATALLLILVIIVLNLAAIAIRNRLREKYKALDQ